MYTAKPPSKLKLTPLTRSKPFTGEQLFQQLTTEAEALRKEKKRNVYTGIHKYVLHNVKLVQLMTQYGSKKIYLLILDTYIY